MPLWLEGNGLTAALLSAPSSPIEVLNTVVRVVCSRDSVGTLRGSKIKDTRAATSQPGRSNRKEQRAHLALFAARGTVAAVAHHARPSRPSSARPVRRRHKLLALPPVLVFICAGGTHVLLLATPRPTLLAVAAAERTVAAVAAEPALPRKKPTSPKHPVRTTLPLTSTERDQTAHSRTSERMVGRTIVRSASPTHRKGIARETRLSRRYEREEYGLT